MSHSKNPRTWVCEFQVRGYELDAYGHVNNAVYLNYAEFARWSMIEQATGSSSYFRDHGVAPVIARAEIDYKEPCVLAEWIRVETSLVECSRKVARFRQRMLKRDSGRLAAEVRVASVGVDASGKAVDLPHDLQEKLG